MKSPLSVVLISQGDAADTEPYVKSLKRAFLGMDSRDLNAAPDYEWLHPLDFRAFSYTKENQKNGDEVLKVLAPNGVTEDIVGSSERVLVVVLLGKANGDDATELASSWRKLADAEDHVSVLFVSLSSDQVPEAVGEAHWGKIEALGLKELDERDLRQDLLTLHTMQMAICLLFKKVRTVPGNSRGVRPKRPKIFFSHAKKDGVPLAKSVKNWLKGLKGFKSFYDTDDLDLTGDISKQLKSAVAGSIVVALRTEVYDSRYWCQKEVYWAEMYNRPLVTVDARWNVQHGPAVIGLDGSPSVRIPDGSITRILLAAMKEGLRIGLFDSRVELAAVQNGNRVKYEKISRYPTLASLAGAIERLNKGKTRAPGFLVYPNPALPDDVEIIAKDVAKKMREGVILCSLDEFRIHGGRTGGDDGRPFWGRKIGITCSADESDLSPLGFSKDAINDFVIDLSRRVIALGGTVVLGHKWHIGGIMEALGKFALAYKAVNATPEAPIVVNYLAHPDAPELSQTEKVELGNYIRIDSTEWPDHHDASYLPPKGKPDSKRARDLFANRERLVGECDARIVIGGRPTSSTRSVSGVLEESWLALKREKLLICSTGFNGMAKKIAETKSGREVVAGTKVKRDQDYLDEMGGLVRRAKDKGLFLETKEFAVGALIKLLDEKLTPA